MFDLGLRDWKAEQLPSGTVQADLPDDVGHFMSVRACAQNDQIVHHGLVRRNRATPF